MVLHWGLEYRMFMCLCRDHERLFKRVGGPMELANRSRVNKLVIGRGTYVYCPN